MREETSRPVTPIEAPAEASPSLTAPVQPGPPGVQVPFDQLIQLATGLLESYGEQEERKHTRQLDHDRQLEQMRSADRRYLAELESRASARLTWIGAGIIAVVLALAMFAAWMNSLSTAVQIVMGLLALLSSIAAAVQYGRAHAKRGPDA